MRSIRLRAIGLALLVYSASASAANWVEVITDVEGAVWYVDVSSIRGSAGARYVWVKVDASADNTVSYRSSTRQFKVNCTKWTMRMLSFTAYDANGRLVSSNSETDYVSGIAMKPIVPETTGDAVARITCGNQ